MEGEEACCLCFILQSLTWALKCRRWGSAGVFDGSVTALWKLQGRLPGDAVTKQSFHSEKRCSVQKCSGNKYSVDIYISVLSDRLE